ncbi:hypothetical protein SVIO_005040 [Streptomyces violaceusniger]|uniref:Major facilitator superfamily (MFS) profile domain-containing protein n=1 Tax=Streptomyces violaceusniger TaxID=68280 RepID=A0A4D4KL45_STRVO|nr:hypothetical protein SVIO_005040 [Streptomyces violaceusniger]
MTTFVADGEAAKAANAALIARLERLPVTRRLTLIRVIVGSATFFDAYTVLAIAFAMPQLVDEWNLSSSQVGLILSAGYLGQLVGALVFGALAERIGRLHTLLITIVLFVSMDIACLFAWSGTSMMIFRFVQGVGTGGEVPVASAYINEFIGARKRGRFFLMYEVIFPAGLMFAGIAAYFLAPVFGWRALFVVGLIPSVLAIPLRWLMPESPAGSPPRAATRRPRPSYGNWRPTPPNSACRCPSRSSARWTRCPRPGRTGASSSKASTSSGPS